MSTASSPQVSLKPVSLEPVSLEPVSLKPVSLARLTRVEYRKMLDTRASKWLLGLCIGLQAVAIGIAVWVTIATSSAVIELGTLLAAVSYPMLLFVSVIVLLSATAEWSQRTGAVTFALAPSRVKVYVAKLLAGTGLTLVVALIGTLIAVVGELIMASAADANPLWSDTNGYLQYLLGVVLIMLFALGLGCLMLNSASAVSAYFVAVFFAPVILSLLPFVSEGLADVVPWVNLFGWRDLLVSGEMPAEDFPELLVSAALWIGLPLVVGLLRVRRAEVK